MIFWRKARPVGRVAKASWQELHGWPAWLLLIWLLAMLTLPITSWVWGERLLYLHISISVLLQAILSTALLALCPLSRGSARTDRFG